MVAMIELKGVEKTFVNGRVATPVLRGIDLVVEEGEYLALMGPSGAGKSTLMNVIGLLDRPSQGEYQLDGEDVIPLSDGELSRLRNERIGFVFQLFHLLPRLTILNNVLLPLLYTSSYPAEAKRRAMGLLSSVGIADRARYKPTTLSGGQQQRAAIARSLINAPSILLADEPTGNLDEASSTEVMKIFDRLHSEGRTIVLVTHDPSIAQRAERIVHLHDGAVSAIEVRQ